MIHPVSELGEGVFVESMDWYSRGTVIWGVFVDSQERRAFVGIDGRVARPTRYRLYERAKHPNSDRAVFIDRGAREERLVVELLARWVESPESEICSLQFKSKLREMLLHFEASGLRDTHDVHP
jgi:hypothetical protein